jgi:hypothetical protein
MIVFYDLNTKGDIVIQDIELVQKPLPKFTINGIDGFLSGKWYLHPNAKVIDDETLELNATGGGQASSVDTLVTPSTSCILSLIKTGGSGSCIQIQEFDIAGVLLKTSAAISTEPLVYTFTTLPNTVKLRLLLTTNYGGGVYIFKRPMLTLGSIPVPYSKKTGDRMVMPVPKKNLFDGVLEDGIVNTFNGDPVPTAGYIRSRNFQAVTPNKVYTFSKSRYIHFYTVNKTWISSSALQDETKSTTFTTPSNCYFIKFHITGTDSTTKVQLEEGTVSKPYEPYAVQVNKKPQHAIIIPKRLLPKKRLLEAKR